MEGKSDHARYKEWFRHCLADAAGPSPKRRRLLEGFNQQKTDATESGKKFRLDLSRLVSSTKMDWAICGGTKPAAAQAGGDKPAAAQAGGPARGLQRRRTV